ncbi:hypothetical protein P4H42_02610 [Paenibacillus macerans]|uniref:hypothetical protein n=1 Tax=Paenibacillus macerans TaxID=44252 RepID=UPI002DBCB039|nr:hypothetical protein [Paenibacillus macerans]MEC0328517.1 hypothetical protein [Paenibacillus macerans]
MWSALSYCNGKTVKSPSELIEERIKELGDWRSQLLSKLGDLVKRVEQEEVEE